MRHQWTALGLSAMLLAAPLPATEREVIKTNWSGFVDQVAARKLKDRMVRASLTGGKTIKARLLKATATGLVVPVGRATKTWATGSNEALIPSQQVSGVRFEGRTGHGRLIGALAGAAAGAGIGAGVASSSVETFEGIGVFIVPIAAVTGAITGAVGGYFAGRAFDRRAPEFLLSP